MKIKIIKNVYSKKIEGSIVEAERLSDLFLVSGLILSKIDPAAFANDDFRYAFLASEIEEYTEPEIKVGDKVRLKEKFYDEPDFKTENRFARKEISKNKGFEIMVHKIISEGMRVSSDENKGAFTIPISLLEKVEEPVVKEVSRRAKVGEFVKVIRKYKELKVGDIGKVSCVGFGYNIDVCGKLMYTDFGNCVVLENYKPEPFAVDASEIKIGTTKIPEEKIEPKVGMYVEVTTKVGHAPVGSKCELRTVGKDKGNGTYSVTYFDKDDPRGYSYGTIGCKCKLLPNYKPLRKWTEAEITEAKCIIAEIEVEGVIYSKASALGFEGTNTNASFNHKESIARCSVHDEYNMYIGSMVALCKASGRKLPSWINKD